MYKKIITSAILLVSVIVFVWFRYPTQVVNALGLIRSGQNISSMRTSSSTTTPNWLLTGTGTTTLTFYSEEYCSVTVYMNTHATSSGGAFNSVLNIDRYGSDDRQDFFNYDTSLQNPATIFSATTSVALASTTMPLTFVPSTVGATTSKVFNINLLPARHTRLVFSLVSSTTPFTQRQSMNLWVNLAGRTFCD